MKAFLAVSCAVLSMAGCSEPKLDKDGNPITVGRFRLRTFPKGASVWVDGKLVAQTPATLIKEAGTYHLKIQLPGAEAIERTIEIEAGESDALNLRIPTPPPATLTVLSDAEGADVRINGYRRGATPLFRVNTKPGPIDVTVTRFDGRAKSIRTRLKASEQKTIELFFDPVASQTPPPPPPAILQSRPKGKTTLTLGLKPQGIIETQDGQLLGKTPLKRHAIAPGTHRLVLRSKDGQYEKRVVIDIEPGQHAVYRFMMTKDDEVSGWTPPKKP